jgi:hypothetical protein
MLNLSPLPLKLSTLTLKLGYQETLIRQSHTIFGCENLIRKPLESILG